MKLFVDSVGSVIWGGKVDDVTEICWVVCGGNGGVVGKGGRLSICIELLPTGGTWGVVVYIGGGVAVFERKGNTVELLNLGGGGGDVIGRIGIMLGINVTVLPSGMNGGIVLGGGGAEVE